MLCSQPPCTPTRGSNRLTAQATEGANSLSTSTTPPDPGASRASFIRHRESSHAWSALLVPMLTVATSGRPTRSLSTKADTSVPAITVIPPPATGVIIHGRITNITSYSQANMPTSCSIICPPPYTNVGDDGAMSSNSSSQDLLPKVSDLLV
jgi:hypothetical protein